MRSRFAVRAPAPRPDDPVRSATARGRALLLDAAIAIGVATLAALVFLQTRSFGFVNFDDPSYLSANDAVRAGLSWRGARWAFTTFATGNWHPLTWLSLMLDIDLFGVDPGRSHLVNVVLHAVNAIMLYATLRAATGIAWRSALVAALFAVHPLHVESVAWISERKDLLSAFFGLLCLAAHVRYARTGRISWYLGSLGALVLGLASKPMLVSAPVLLLLLDRWPLRRSEPLARLVLEKIPFFLAAAASSAVTIVAQRAGGAVTTLAGLPLSSRIANAVVSYAGYLGKTVWPSSLAAAYPHPAFAGSGISPAAVAASAALLLVISCTCALQWRRRPFLAIGWAWFLVTLVPVSGLVQVGIQSMADRYTYLPLVGIFLSVVWAVPDRIGRAARLAVAAGCAVVIATLAMVAHAQTAYWSDSVTLFEHALTVTGDNPTALRNLGVAHVERGEYRRGILALRESLRIFPGDAWAWMDLGVALTSSGDDAGAEDAFREAFRLRPDDETVLYNVGMFAATHGRADVLRTVLTRLQEVSPPLARELASRAHLE